MYKIRLIEDRGSVRLRDGKTLQDPVKELSGTGWVEFNHRPMAEDLNLEIEEITATQEPKEAEPEKPKRRRRRRKVEPEAGEG
jgi:hypothetical protein